MLPWLPDDSAGRCSYCATTRRRVGLRVERQHEPARLRVDLRHGAVVEHADRAVGERVRVVLVGGPRAGAELHARVPAADLALQLAAGGVHLVHRPRVARGDQRRPVGALVDRVDVEVVERPLRAAAGRRAVGVAERHVVEAVPLAPHEPRAQVDFLEDAVGDGAAARAADDRQVAVDRVERPSAAPCPAA